MISDSKEVSSFRDPSGFIFYEGNEVFRAIDVSYQKQYKLLKSSGLLKELIERGLLIDHREVSAAKAKHHTTIDVISPTTVPFISYPYEWSFSQLKDAALVTLEIQDVAFKYGFTLKDASAFNIQFFEGRPLLIDTLSFDIYQKGQGWVAYRQFCKHFLAPLSLQARADLRLSRLQTTNVDGIDLDLACKILPKKTFFNLHLFMHLYLHSKSEKKFSDLKKKVEIKPISENAFRGVTDSLRSAILSLRLPSISTTWSDYYDDTNYSSAGTEHKKKIVGEMLEATANAGAGLKVVWDIGANTGEYTRIAAAKSPLTISFDIDPLAVEKNYLKVKENREKNILPLILDLTNPTPGIGWRNSERTTIFERGRCDTLLALALIHHLAIANNIPLLYVSEMFKDLCRNLIIEFIPKSDSQVQRLLRNRQDVFPSYDQSGFENAFGVHFDIVKKQKVQDSDRVLYLMKNKNELAKH